MYQKFDLDKFLVLYNQFTKPCELASLNWQSKTPAVFQILDIDYSLLNKRSLDTLTQKDLRTLLQTSSEHLND